MKISNETIELLKNFSTINQSFLFKPGNTLRTISPMKNIFAEATVAETFPIECAIYELPKFLSVISLFDEPNLEFDEQYVTISSSKNKAQSVRYYYAVKTLIIAPPDKSPKIAEEIDTFDLRADDLNKLLKGSVIMGLPHFVVETKNSVRTVSVMNKSVKGSNNLTIEEGDSEASNYDVVVNVDKLKMMSDAYGVLVGQNGKSKFVSFVSSNVSYFIAAEPRV